MTDVPESRGPARGKSDVTLRVHETEDDEVTYLPADHEVRYGGGYRPTKNPSELDSGERPERERSFTTSPAERWGTMRCVDAAAKAATEHVAEVLDTGDVRWIVTSLDESGDRTVVVETIKVLARDGSVDSTPDVDFESLRSATPHSVSASYELEDFEYELDVPIYAGHAVLQRD